MPCWALQEITPNPPRDNSSSSTVAALTLQSPARARKLPLSRRPASPERGQRRASPGEADGKGGAEKAQPAFETRPPRPDTCVLGSRPATISSPLCLDRQSGPHGPQDEQEGRWANGKGIARGSLRTLGAGTNS